MLNKSNIVVVILVGGFGTRVKSVLGDTPKPLAIINEKPFLYWLITYYIAFGFKDFVLSACYNSSEIINFVERFNFSGVRINVVIEKNPLGTYGAFLNSFIESNTEKDYLVINGDSITTYNPNDFLASIPGNIRASIVTVNVDEAGRYGQVTTDHDGFLSSFDEKIPGRGQINAGIYFFRNNLLQKESATLTKSSFEYDYFPKLIRNHEKIAIFNAIASFIDIGTEASLAEAENFVLNNLNEY